MKNLIFKYSNIIEKLKHFVITLLAVIAAYLILYLIHETWLFKFPEFTLHSKHHSNRLDNYINNKSLLFIIIVPSIIIPIIEEILFRSWLILSPRNIALFIGSLPYLLLKLLFPDMSWEVVMIMSLCMGIILYKLTYILLLRFHFKPIKSKKIIISLVILSSIIFGFVHITNYPKINIYSVVLIIPHFFTGLAYAYLRIKNGLNWAFFLHSLNNLSLTIMLLTEKL